MTGVTGVVVLLCARMLIEVLRYLVESEGGLGCFGIAMVL